MKFLLTAVPVLGHLNPLLAVAQMLIRRGDEVLLMSTSNFRARIEGVGARFYPFEGEADIDLSNPAAVFPEIIHIPAGPERLRFAFEHVFAGFLVEHDRSVREALKDFPADAIMADNCFLGLLPMLLGPKANRPPIIFCGTSILFWHRPDHAPFNAGLPPAQNDIELKSYRVMAGEFQKRCLKPINQTINQRLEAFGVGPLPADIFDSIEILPDAHLQFSVPSFEYPRIDLPAKVHFVGTPPMMPGDAAAPLWSVELDGKRRVVLVTQGTVANSDLSMLIAPTLRALAYEADILVVATMGGRPKEHANIWVPDNARLETFLSLEWLLPHVDVLVTNGGYGTVNQALSFGVPIVAAGTRADKADVGARIAWSGVGIDLKTETPPPLAIRRAVRTVLDHQTYRRRASSLQNEFAAIDTSFEVLRIINDVCIRHWAAAMPIN